MFFRKDIAHRAFKPTAATREALTYASAGVSIDAGNEFVEEIKKVRYSISSVSQGHLRLIVLRKLPRHADQEPTPKLVALVVR